MGVAKRPVVIAGAAAYVILKWMAILTLGPWVLSGAAGGWAPVLLIIPAAGAAAYWRRRKRRHGGLPARFRRIVAGVLEGRYGSEVEALIPLIEARFEALSADTRFAATSANPLDRRLNWAAFVLAIILTLDDRSEGFETIRNVCLDIARQQVQPTSQLSAWAKTLPPRLLGRWPVEHLLRALGRRVSPPGHPDGFTAEIVTDPAQTFGLGYGLNITACGICKLFAKHDAHRFAAILCEVDELTSSLAGLTLVRQSTIAQGASHCDFRFKRRPTTPEQP